MNKNQPTETNRTKHTTHEINFYIDNKFSGVFWFFHALNYITYSNITLRIATVELTHDHFTTIQGIIVYTHK